MMFWSRPIQKEHPKVLILVLSALRDPWGHMLRVQQETWDSVEHPQCRTLYYVGRCEPLPAGVDMAKVFHTPNFGEELEEIVHRTREAFEISLKSEWDYLARVHSSGYVHKQNLVDFVESGIVPSENLFCGLLTTGEKPFLWGGGSYILSRDVVQKFVEEAADSGVDIFRIFDSLNWTTGMRVAMEAVRKQGKICEAAICYTGDITDPNFVRELVAGCDIVFHLAALIGIPYSYHAPASYVSTNIVGTLNILEACRQAGVRRVILTSTSEVYGTARRVPIDESHPLQGQSPYSATKIAADKLATENIQVRRQSAIIYAAANLIIPCGLTIRDTTSLPLRL
jgi:hypothetical protein